MANKYTRRDQVLDYIEQTHHVSVAEICEEFSVSEATARRILDELARETKVQRIRGGAIALNNAPSGRGYRTRSLQQEEEKWRIGKAASDLIEDGDTVFLGSGSTVAEVAFFLRERHNLTVMTNSIPVMESLKDVPAIRLIGFGGVLQQSEQSFIGHLTEQALAEMHADKVIAGIRAIDIDRGLMNHEPLCTQTERAILGIGQQVILVADHTKCARVDVAFVAPLTVVHTLVTDSATPPEFVAALTERGIHVVRA